MTNDIERIKSFVASYKQTIKEISNERLCRVKKMVELFAKEKERLHEVIRQETPYYNIFEVLKIRHYEVKVHTPFIKNLLDPKGSHNQNRLFFDSFLSNVLNLKNSIERSASIKVNDEQRNQFGQIDIEIWYESEGKSKAIVIENKIYHHDGDQQLFRYYKYLTDQRKMKDENITLVYLTIDGKEPDPISLMDTPRSCLHLISYRTDIAAWLSMCNEQICTNALAFTIKQYLKTIESL